LFRSFLNRRLAPKAAEARRPMAEKLVTALLNRVIGTGKMDMVDDLTNPLPALVTMEFFGLPLHEWRQFADPLHQLMYIAKTRPEYPAAVAGMEWMMKRVKEESARKRQQPGDDLLTHLATGEIDGKKLDDDTIWQISFNLLIGGVDTTTALTSNVLLYLNDRPDERRFLAENHDKWPVAREEFIRFFSPIHGLARNVSQPATVNGQKMEPGERIYIAYSGANRDPEIFEDPDTIKLDRFPNRHIGFGAGQHRCIGSFLARMMFETMLDAVLTRVPDYRIDADKAENYPSVGVVNGWISLPATFTPGPKVPVDIEL
jgi:cytochrome P450